jgi:uncharacterized RDD family membrane protein YckC
LTEQPPAYAGFLRRLAAGAIDWSLVLVLATAASIAVLPWIGGTPAAILALGGTALATFAYFAIGWARWSQTLGMRAAGILVRQYESGCAVGGRRAALRALVALASGVSAFLALALVVADRPDGGYSGADLAVTGAALLWAEVSVAGHLWQLVDRRKQSWQDKLFGLVVVHTS